MSASPIFILAPARPMVRIATLIGRIRRATTWSKQARTFDVLPLARAAACGLGALRFGAAYVGIGDSAQPFLVIEKSKFAAHRIICASVLDGEARRALFGQGFGCGPISRGVGAQKSVIAAPSAGVKVATESLAIGALSIWRSLHIASAIGRLEPYRDSRLKRLGRMAF